MGGVVDRLGLRFEGVRVQGLSLRAQGAGLGVSF